MASAPGHDGSTGVPSAGFHHPLISVVTNMKNRGPVRSDAPQVGNSGAGGEPLVVDEGSVSQVVDEYMRERIREIIRKGNAVTVSRLRLAIKKQIDGAETKVARLGEELKHRTEIIEAQAERIKMLEEKATGYK